MRSLGFASLIALAACASSQERCIEAAQEDLNVVNALIASVEADLERGFTVRSEQTSNIGVIFCTGRSSIRFCTAGNPTRRDVPEAINRTELEAQLADLREKRVELQARTADEISACRAEA